LISTLALVARLKPAGWKGYGWLWMLLLGLCSGLFGGLLGFWFLGRVFATPTALWIAVLATVVPWLWYKGSRHFLHE
jgi:hypothetical protein